MFTVNNSEHINTNNSSININNNDNKVTNPRGSESLGWHAAGNSRVSWVGRSLKSWLVTFLREKNSNIKLGVGESLVLVGNHLQIVSR